MIAHLQRLGVTAVELMPVHQFVAEQSLVDRGLTNYWGYNTIGFLAPHNRYSSAGQRGEQVGEFKAMVKALHEAGIEVILDVVYNHTAEGDHMGPTLSFRGIDNAAYYRLSDSERWRYLDYTGCGNSLNARHPHTLQLVMDSLRYWILEMHVDGFRFDLAAALARELHDVDRLSTFFDLVQQDPVVSQVKLIAEPWDVGEGGYQVGNFPPLWTEWNGKYRDTVRDFWRGRPATCRVRVPADRVQRPVRDQRAPPGGVDQLRHLPRRVHADRPGQLQPQAQRGQRRGQPGRHRRQPVLELRGRRPDRRSRVNALRARQKRNFLVTLFLSQGVPMLLAGDEMGRTQGGNNNAYCQDNADVLAGLGPGGRGAGPAAVHRDAGQPAPGASGVPAAPVLPRQPHGGRRDGRHRLADAFRPGNDPADWEAGYAKSLAVFLNGEAISEPDPRGGQITDAKFLLLFNAHSEALTFTLPKASLAAGWEVVIDTASGVPGVIHPPKKEIEVRDHAVVVLRSTE